MSSSEATYSVTFVQGKPPMITVRADSADEWKVNLDKAAASGALAGIKAINDSLNGVRPSAQPSAPAPAAPGPSEDRTQQANQAAQDLPDGFATVPCGTCGGPTRFDKEGISRQSGTPYKRYSCTTNQLHKATFTN